MRDECCGIASAIYFLLDQWGKKQKCPLGCFWVFKPVFFFLMLFHYGDFWCMHKVAHSNLKKRTVSFCIFQKRTCLQGTRSLNASKQTAKQVSDKRRRRRNSYASIVMICIFIRSVQLFSSSFFIALSAFQRVKNVFSTDAIIAAAILGVAILILLGVLLYCLVRGRRKSMQHQRVPVSTIPVTYEDRERLVYNSTTKPYWPRPRPQF